MDFSRLLKGRRKELLEAGIPKGTVTRLLYTNSNPSLATLAKIEDFLPSHVMIDMEELNQLRQEKSLTFTAISIASGLEDATISTVLARTRTPSYSTAVKIRDAIKNLPARTIWTKITDDQAEQCRQMLSNRNGMPMTIIAKRLNLGYHQVYRQHKKLEAEKNGISVVVVETNQS